MNYMHPHHKTKTNIDMCKRVDNCHIKIRERLLENSKINLLFYKIVGPRFI